MDPGFRRGDKRERKTAATLEGEERVAAVLIRRQRGGACQPDQTVLVLSAQPADGADGGESGIRLRDQSLMPMAAHHLAGANDEGNLRLAFVRLNGLGRRHGVRFCHRSQVPNSSFIRGGTWWRD